MKNNFNEYAKLYNIFYANKPYENEISNIFSRFNVENNTLAVELGCGTGNYSKILSKYFDFLIGIDLSPKMIAIAQQYNSSTNISYKTGNLINFNLPNKVSTIFSLFHVMSYINGLEDVSKVFENISKNLLNGGLFIFDTWAASGLVENKLETRYVEVVKDNVIYKRLSTFKHYPEKEIVEVEFTIFSEPFNALNKVIKEKHSMQYWSTLSLELIASKYKLKLTDVFDLKTGKEITRDSFSKCYIFKKDE